MTEINNCNNNQTSRRDFIKFIGGSAAAITVGGLTVGGLTGCDRKNNKSNNLEVPTDKMTYRTSKSGDKISLLGYGAMRFPFIAQPDGTEIIDQEYVNELTDYAIAHGVNVFDTSPRYSRGFSETALGIALARHPRDKFYVMTKLSNFSKESRTSEASMEMYHKSMRDLQVDYIDYYLIHSVGSSEPMLKRDPKEGALGAVKERIFDNGMLDFILAEKKAGRIRNLGFSFHGDVAIYDYMLQLHDEGVVEWDFAMIQLNYIDMKYPSAWNVRADYLYDELAKRNIPAVIMEPLLGGRLANIPQHLSIQLKQREPNKSIASWAFRFAGSFPGVLTSLSGMRTLEHLQDNIRTHSPLVPLNEEEMELLDSIATQIMETSAINCTACEYCMPCPYGIDIAGIISHYNNMVAAGNIAESRQDPEYRRARQAFLVGYDRAVPKLRQAAHCIHCNLCVPACPQKLDIPMELMKIHNYAEDLRQGRL